MFRIREKRRRASVVQTFDGSDHYNIYLKQVAVPSLRPKEKNKLAILAVYEQHWFYINDALVGEHVIPRLDRARLDVGVVAGAQQKVIGHFQNFRVYVPAVTETYPALTRLVETTI